jgi:hypothetical protein
VNQTVALFLNKTPDEDIKKETGNITAENDIIEEVEELNPDIEEKFKSSWLKEYVIHMDMEDSNNKSEENVLSKESIDEQFEPSRSELIVDENYVAKNQVCKHNMKNHTAEEKNIELSNTFEVEERQISTPAFVESESEWGLNLEIKDKHIIKKVPTVEGDETMVKCPMNDSNASPNIDRHEYSIQCVAELSTTKNIPSESILESLEEASEDQTGQIMMNGHIVSPPNMSNKSTKTDNDIKSKELQIANTGSFDYKDPIERANFKLTSDLDAKSIGAVQNTNVYSKTNEPETLQDFKSNELITYPISMKSSTILHEESSLVGLVKISSLGNIKTSDISVNNTPSNESLLKHKYAQLGLSKEKNIKSIEELPARKKLAPIDGAFQDGIPELKIQPVSIHRKYSPIESKPSVVSRENISTKDPVTVSPKDINENAIISLQPVCAKIQSKEIQKLQYVPSTKLSQARTSKSIQLLSPLVISPLEKKSDEKENYITKFDHLKSISIADLSKEEFKKIKDSFKSLHWKIYGEQASGHILREELLEYNSMKKILKSR